MQCKLLIKQINVATPVAITGILYGLDTAIKNIHCRDVGTTSKQSTKQNHSVLLIGCQCKQLAFCNMELASQTQAED